MTIYNNNIQFTYDAWINTCALYILQTSKLVGLATDGATTMLGGYKGFAAKLKRNVLELLSVYCIADRETLTASNTFKKIKQLDLLGMLANGVYGWVGMSSLRNGEL